MPKQTLTAAFCSAATCPTDTTKVVYWDTVVSGFTLEVRATGGKTYHLRYFDDHDELYWNVTGTGWIFPIREASASVELPGGARATDTTYYTGPEGSREQDARQTGSAGAPEFVTTRPLGYRCSTIAPERL